MIDDNFAAAFIVSFVFLGLISLAVAHWVIPQ